MKRPRGNTDEDEHDFDSDLESDDRRQRKTDLQDDSDEDAEVGPPPPPSDIAVRQEDKPGVGATRNDWAEGRTGGVYVPPFRLARMQAAAGSSDAERQRIAWEALKKRMNGLINKVNVGNIAQVVPDVFQENLIRGMGLFCRSLMKSQLTSPEYTNVYCALVAVVNSKMPEIGELLVTRVVAQFRRAYKRRDKILCMASIKFIAHLVNQCVAHELVALQLISLLLERPTDDSVEVCVGFIKECGALLSEATATGIHAVFERMRAILHEGEIDKRIQYMIEGLMVVRRKRFEDYPPVVPGLDLVEDDDKITHEISLDDDLDLKQSLDIFQYDPKYNENEAKYAEIRREILGDNESEGDEEDDDDVDNGQDGFDEGDQEVAGNGAADPVGHPKVADMTEGELIGFRRTVYLTIMSALSHEEASHKLVRLMQGNPGRERELCGMLVECCSQERSYLTYYGLLGVRFCQLGDAYVDRFEELFAEYYATIHRCETNKIRNIARFFAALLFADGVPWSIFELVSLNEEETNASSRIFLKVLFQELAKDLGVEKLDGRLHDPSLEAFVSGLFPREPRANLLFSINFFTSIGLGALTDRMREFLKHAPPERSDD